MTDILRAIVEPGFFHSSAVGNAIAVGAIVAVVSGVVGIFTVIRSQAFAGEALGDIGSTGGAAAYLMGVGPLWGYVGLSLLGATFMSVAGAGTRRGRDVDTGIVVGGALGLAALFLYLDTTHSNTTGASITILFGSIFTVPASSLPAVLGIGVAAVLTLVALYRMLLLTSLHPDLAAARGTSVHTVSIAYLVLLGMAVSLSALTVGAILSTTLLIGPAAAALRLTSRPGPACLFAALIGVGTTWLGILLAYDSCRWPGQHGWPASFLIVVVVFAAYLLARFFGRKTGRTGEA